MMKNIFSKIGAIAIMTIFLLPSTLVFAAEGDYQVLAPLPGVADNVGDTTTLEKYVPAIFKLAIGLATVAAVLMIVIGGFEYMTTDAIQGKSAGKERIKNAVFGLILVIGAWLILFTINPNLINVNLEIGSVTTTAPPGTEGTLSPALPTNSVMEKITASCPLCSTSGGLTYNISAANLARFDCQNCKAFDSSIPFGGNTSINANPNLNNSLLALNNGLKAQNVNWRVTEAFPPVVNHSDGCHYNGSCVDAALSSPTPENIKRFLDTSKNNGLNPTYEVKTQAEADTLISNLKKIGVTNPPVVVNSSTNGDHFHLK